MLRITAGPFSFAARLEEEDAPETVAAFRRLLPLESRIIHVRWSGEAGWIPFGDLDLGLGPENATCYPHPGEIVLYPGGVSETEILLAWALEPDDAGSGGTTTTIAYAQVAPVIEQRCAPCHAQAPTEPGFSSPPAGIVLETPEQIAARANEIKTVVSTKAMPLGNLTGMTSEERALVVAWVMCVRFPSGIAFSRTACCSIADACAAISSGVSNAMPCGGAEKPG